MFTLIGEQNPSKISSEQTCYFPESLPLVHMHETQVWHGLVTRLETLVYTISI
jgi:hypothetical protein